MELPLWAQEKEYQTHHLVICSRNHEYSVLSRKDQRMGLEFRYANPNM